MDQQQDRKFFIYFAAVLAGLGGFTLFLMAVAGWVTPDYEDSAALKRIEDRIRPVGQVVTDPAVLLKAAAAVQRAPYSGAEVVAKVCGACHQSGVLGATKIGDKGDWSRRKAALGGIEGLVKSAIKGKNAMPARGGDASLTDAEIRDSVLHMLKGSGL